MDIEKLLPAYKDYLWGGEKLKTKYGKDTELVPCAESWELSFHPDGLTRLFDRTPLADAVTPAQLGENVSAFDNFPMLVKFIDAKQDLSVQVHPSDAYALKHEGSYGKTEMWYIVDAEVGAGIYLGLKRDVSPEELRAAIKDHTLTELLNFCPVKAGECYFIPAGTIHAIGKGTLICEIQQNSNLTYRVYDWGRVDKNGAPRELHIDKALAVSNMSRHTAVVNNGELLGVSRYFTVRRIRGDRCLQADGKSFHCLVCTAGEGSVGKTPIKAGHSVFVPADYGAYEISGDMELLLCEVRKYYVRIDFGEALINGGIVDDIGRTIVTEKVAVKSGENAARVAESIASLTRELLSRVSLTAQDVVGLDIGVPEPIEGHTGKGVCASSLGENFMICDELSSMLGIPTRIAAPGEVRFA